MTAFALPDGTEGTYDAGLITLGDGVPRGVETIVALVPREEAERPVTDAGLPGTLGALSGRLRGALPPAGGLPLAARLALSSVRAGLGALAEGLAPQAPPPANVEIAFADGTRLVAALPEALAQEIARDRALVLAALARAALVVPASVEPVPQAEDAAQALTSIFRYEKRNGRLRRVVDAGPASEP